MQNVHFSPAQIGRLVGVNESTVKRWIDAGLLPAHTTSGGHRRVSEEDLQTFMREKRDEANTRSYHLARMARTKEAGAWRRYLALLLDDKHVAARQYVTGFMLTHGSARTTVESVIAPTLAKIGAAWHRGELDIADEHRMTFRIRGDVYALDALLPAPVTRAPHIVLACVPGDNHELALGLIALTTHELGYEPIVLGINVPLREIVRTVESTPHLRAVGLAKIYTDAPDTQEYVRTLRNTSKLGGIPILLGGGGWSTKERTTYAAMPGVTICESIDVLRASLTNPKCTFRARTQSRVSSR